MVMKIIKKTCSHKGKCSCNGSSRKMKGGRKEPTHNQLMKIFNDLLQKENVIDRFKQANIEALDNVEEMGEKESKREYKEALILLRTIEIEIPVFKRDTVSDSVSLRNEMMRNLKEVLVIYRKPLEAEIKMKLQNKLIRLQKILNSRRDTFDNTASGKRANELVDDMFYLVGKSLEVGRDEQFELLDERTLEEPDYNRRGDRFMRGQREQERDVRIEDNPDDDFGQALQMLQGRGKPKYKPKNKNRQKVMTIASKLQKKGYNKSQALKLAYKVMKE